MMLVHVGRERGAIENKKIISSNFMYQSYM
jgi:hypothetical protein